MIIFETHTAGDTQFDFDGNGVLTVERKADAYTSYVDKYVPAEWLKSKRYVYKADTMPPAEVPDFLMKEGSDGWQLASAYVIGNVIQCILMKEVRP